MLALVGEDSGDLPRGGSRAVPHDLHTVALVAPPSSCAEPNDVFSGFFSDIKHPLNILCLCAPPCPPAPPACPRPGHQARPGLSSPPSCSLTHGLWPSPAPGPFLHGGTFPAAACCPCLPGGSGETWRRLARQGLPSWPQRREASVLLSQLLSHDRTPAGPQQQSCPQRPGGQGSWVEAWQAWASLPGSHTRASRCVTQVVPCA